MAPNLEQASTEGRKGTGVEIKLINKRTVHKAILQVGRHSLLSPLYVFNTSSRELRKNLDKLKNEGDVPNLIQGSYKTCRIFSETSKACSVIRKRQGRTLATLPFHVTLETLT